MQFRRRLHRITVLTSNWKLASDHITWCNLLNWYWSNTDKLCPENIIVLYKKLHSANWMCNLNIEMFVPFRVLRVGNDSSLCHRCTLEANWNIRITSNDLPHVWVCIRLPTVSAARSIPSKTFSHPFCHEIHIGETFCFNYLYVQVSMQEHTNPRFNRVFPHCITIWEKSTRQYDEPEAKLPLSWWTHPLQTKLYWRVLRSL